MSSPTSSAGREGENPTHCGPIESEAATHLVGEVPLLAFGTERRVILLTYRSAADRLSLSLFAEKEAIMTGPARASKRVVLSGPLAEYAPGFAAELER